MHTKSLPVNSLSSPEKSYIMCCFIVLWSRVCPLHIGQEQGALLIPFHAGPGFSSLSQASIFLMKFFSNY